MQRRELIAGILGGTLVCSLAARAQTVRTATIGILNSENPEPLWAYLQEALQDLGYRANLNIRFEFRGADGNRALLRTLAAELVNLNVDVIVAYLSPAVPVVQQLTREIPIVMMGAGDPVGTGLVASLTRPGGNVTG